MKNDKTNKNIFYLFIFLLHSISLTLVYREVEIFFLKKLY